MGTMFHRRTRTDDALQAALASEGDATMSGLIEGTRVATALGWQRVEHVSVGDRVLTFDNGLQPVRSLRSVRLWEGQGRCPRSARPLFVPEGAIGNADAMVVLPRQGLMVESDAAEAMTGDPFALVRAEALDGICGIRRVDAAGSLDVHLLQFDEDEIVFTAHGALCVCAAAGDMLERLFDAAPVTEYRLLSDQTDGHLISRIRQEITAAHADGGARTGAAHATYAETRVA
ncbi:Hint domain-containing protein [Pseudooceanicola sp. LIPI14-2-Ac024]|uniref:Hint domain-containing protein n=1 Tax=Pseudooceanicola sp. LIPI14-2-Ac024 TaxID=3344875 RepID=UPI0035CEF8D3